MSNASLRARDLSRELEAAVLGDFDALKRGSQDAQHFAAAFSNDAGQPWWEETEPDGTLGFAAQAVSHERRGETNEALAAYRKLAAEKAPWNRLLGLLLSGWSFLISDPRPIRSAANEVHQLRRSSRKARLLAKLSGFASDKGDIDAARDIFLDAIQASDPNTQLGRALRVEGSNLGIPMDNMALMRKPPGEEDDDLVWPSQIESLQAASAQAVLTQAVEDQFGGVWRHTMRMGITPLGELDSAEAQARWIGLRWLRRPIWKQMGAQLLAGGAETPPQWAHGVLAWTLGGGSRPALALSFAEPHFDHGGADYLINSVFDGDATGNRYQRLAELGAEGWDLLSDETLRRLSLEIEPAAGQASPAPESRQLWAAFAIRLPDEWIDRYRSLDIAVQGALLDALDPGALRHFTNEMKESMYAALGDDENVLADGGRRLPLAAALAPRSEDDRLRQLVDSDVPKLTRVIARLLEDRPSVISSGAEKRFLDGLHDAVIEQSKKARHGTVALGGAGPRLELGRLLSVSRTVNRGLIELLIEIASDPGLPPQYVMEARQGLILLRRAGRLRETDLKRLRSAPDPPDRGPLAEGISAGVLRIFLLQILIHKLNASERAQLIGAVRSPEERVRSLAVNACAEALESTDDEGIAWALVSGLFDPSDAIASGALAGLLPLTQNFRMASEIAWDRLPILFDASSRRVRSEIIRALAYAPPRTKSQRSKRNGLLARGRQDRSWMVRDAVQEVSADRN